MKYLKFYAARIFQMAMGASAAVLLPLAAHAEVVIQGVTGSIQNGVDVVRVDFKEPLQTLPTGFAIQTRFFGRIQCDGAHYF